MAILQMISLALIAVLLMNMAARARPRTKVPLQGKTLQTIPLGIIPRLVTHRSSLLALLSGCALGILTGWLPLIIAVLVGFFAVLIVLVPMRYTLTTKGVAVGEMMFRPWSDFSGFKAKKASLELEHSSTFGRLTLFVKPAEMGNVLQYVERHIHNVPSTNS